MRLKVYALKQIDKYYDYAVQAVINRKSTATQKQGSYEVYVYKTPDDMFCKKSAEDSLLGKGEFAGLRQIAKNLQEFRGKGDIA